jgi:hypothetical protein
MDSSNQFFVGGSPGRFGTGCVTITRGIEPGQRLSREEANNLAAWILVMANSEPGQREEFDRLVEEIEQS